jgi:GTP-binding protein HflX
LNTLTQAGVLAEDKLFATLDPRARKLHLPDGRDVVLTDTVGFIREMPKALFAAFRSTFEETRDADLLIELVDASNHEHSEHVETTKKLLDELGLTHIPRVVVYNKVDLLGAAERTPFEEEPGAVAICANRKETTAVLLRRIAELLPDARLEPPVEHTLDAGEYVEAE